MPRLRQVPRAEAVPSVHEMYARLCGDRDPVAAPGTPTGTPGTWWTVFALVPPIFDHAVAAFGVLLSARRRLPPRRRELAVLRTGYAAGSQFVFSQHSKEARAAGVEEAAIAAIPAWSTHPGFDAADRATLAYTDALVLERGRVSDATFDALHAHLPDEAILELTYLVGTYVLHATACRALRLEYDDVDERVVEIPAPSAGGATR